MPDLDVIVKSLRRCSDMTICPSDCYYRKYAPDCIEKLHRDAINLLKEQNELLKQQAELLKGQAPRVLTIEEVKSMKRLTLCVVEQRSKIHINTFNAEYCGIVTVGNRDFLDFGLYSDKDRYRRSEGGYGKTWRCWNKRPTDEQRQAVKWNE